MSTTQTEPPLTQETKATVLELARDKLERTEHVLSLGMDDADPDREHFAQLLSDLRGCVSQLDGLAEKVERE